MDLNNKHIGLHLRSPLAASAFPLNGESANLVYQRANYLKVRQPCDDPASRHVVAPTVRHP